LLDLAWRAMLQRRKVLFFEIGDLSESQIMGRFEVRAAQIPLEAGKVEYPIKFDMDDNEKMSLVRKVKRFKKPLGPKTAKEAFRRVMKEQIKSKESFLKLSVHPNNSIGMPGIKSTVQRLERQGWVPDVVVIDYADLLIPAPGYSESRDGINANWKAMRGLSQEYHCLLVTATQANAQSYSAESMDMTHFSEDKRKFAHCTGMIGLNQNEKEKEEDITRLNWLVLREAKYSLKRFCYAAGCPALANVAVVSRF
jgi:hypothetical protein